MIYFFSKNGVRPDGLNLIILHNKKRIKFNINQKIYGLLTGCIGTYFFKVYLVHYVVLNTVNYNQLLDSPVTYAVAAAVLAVSYAAAIYKLDEIPIKQMRQARRQKANLPAGAFSVGTGK